MSFGKVISGTNHLSWNARVCLNLHYLAVSPCLGNAIKSQVLLASHLFTGFSTIIIPSAVLSVTWILETSFMKGQLSSCRTSSTMSCSKAESSWTPPWRPELLLFNEVWGDDSGKKPNTHQIKIKTWQIFFFFFFKEWNTIILGY